MRTLVVEDESLSQLLFQKQLEAYGYETTICPDAETALHTFTETFFPLIVSDLGLPGMDGLELCRRIRQIPRGDECMILVVTARDTPRDLKAVLDAGADDYLIKPVDQDLFHIRLTIIERQLYNLTRRKAAEEERRQLETQLRQSQRLEALGILAGGIAHDFNNILGTMLGYTELLLREQPEQSHERDSLQEIYQAGERAAGLVEQILTFSRAQEQQLVPTDIAPVVEEALKMIRATTSANIDIRHNLPADCPRVLADSTQIHQVVVNLAVNARHAMKDEGGVLSVSLEEVSLESEEGHRIGLAPGSYLKLSLADTGCGMPPDVREHIFEPFFTTKDIGEGTGLGLSVVHGIIKSHHGMITVESIPDKGTTFSIFLPVTELFHVPETTPLEPLVHKEKAHILVVEDEESLAKMHELALTKLGYDVTIMTHSLEALELFRADPERFDLVFTDEGMPDMSGTQLSQEILQIRSAIPIVMTTGYSDTISAETAKAIGIREFLPKPVKIGALAHILHEILGE